MASTAPVISPVGYLDGLNSTNFRLGAFLDQFDRKLLKDPGHKGQKYRRRKTKWNPLLFALIYLRELLRSDDTGGVVSFSDAHLDMYRHSLGWTQKWGPKEWRHLWAMCRGSGKSSMIFKILLCWAAVHGHQKFVAAFGASMASTKTHLDFLTTTFATNPRLRRDFTIGGICQLDTYKVNGKALELDIALVNGFRMVGRGIDTTALGLVDEQNNRPTMIILDDIELDEGNYSVYQAMQRLKTLLDKILPLSINAVVEFVGTTTMAEGIVHQIMRALKLGGGDPKGYAWVREENIQLHHYEPLVWDEVLQIRRSFWEHRFSTAFLLAEEAIGSARWHKNYMCEPVNENSLWFAPGDFELTEIDPDDPDRLAFERVILSIDPAVTDTITSDRTGMAVLGLHITSVGRKKVYVLDTKAGRWNADEIRLNAVRLVNKWQTITLVLWERNQGGVALKDAILCPGGENALKRKIRTLAQGKDTAFIGSSYPAASKKARIERLLGHYQCMPQDVGHRGIRVDDKLVSAVGDLESELLNYPESLTVDLIDATATGVWWLLDRPAKKLPPEPTKGIRAFRR